MVLRSGGWNVWAVNSQCELGVGWNFLENFLNKNLQVIKAVTQLDSLVGGQGSVI